MNFRKRKIRFRIYGGVRRLRDRLARARYFRGHGVHSPFVYALVREAFMQHGMPTGDTALFCALRGAGVPSRRAVELQRLFHHCGYTSFGVNCADASDMYVLTREVSEEDTLLLVGDARRRCCTVCIVGPYDSPERTAMCRRIVDAHSSTSVDNRGYLLLFNNHLPKQHFRI